MKATIDPNLYTQIGLDSGSLTILGSIVHSLGDPGEYRVALHHGETVEGVCFITSDKNSPVAQATVDLATLGTPPEQTGGAATTGDKGCGCGGGGEQSSGGQRFTVNPRGYVLFRVSSGAGGYYVHVRRIDADPKDKGYDSRTLGGGDLFSAVVLRPGTYSVYNTLTKAKGALVVTYPKVGEKGHVTPNPVRVVCGTGSFEPTKLQVQPGQGIIFEAKAPSRIEIKLEKPDDGPRGSQTPSRAGSRKLTLK